MAKCKNVSQCVLHGGNCVAVYCRAMCLGCCFAKECVVVWKLRYYGVQKRALHCVSVHSYVAVRMKERCGVFSVPIVSCSLEIVKRCVRHVVNGLISNTIVS